MVERGLAATRSQAASLLMAGRVFVGEQRVDKAGALLDVEADLRVKEGSRFVSRGGEKLEGALLALAVDVTDVVAIDVGASTGGFTDCLLQRGARKVYAVDVGHGQLAEPLRREPRVVNREKTNARHLTAADFAEPIDLVVVDASFIGMEKLLPAIAACLRSGGQLLAMVKPQFEVGREEATRSRGVIRDPAVRDAAIQRATDALAEHELEWLGGCDSQLPGPKGNVEYFMWARRR